MAEKENCELPSAAKKCKLSLSLSREHRFSVVSENEIKNLEKRQVPKTTDASTRWAFKILKDWVYEFNDRNGEEQCPESILSPSCTKEELNKWLTLFIAETRNQNGDQYPPRTIYAILSSILRYMHSENSEYPNFLDKNDAAFATFQTALDNVFNVLASLCPFLLQLFKRSSQRKGP